MAELRLIVDNDDATKGGSKMKALGPASDDDGGPKPVGSPGGPRVLVPGAPASPSAAPLDLARLLRRNEVVVWWNRKPNLNFSLLSALTGLGVVLLLFLTLFAPEFWLRPFSAIIKPVLAVFSPALAILVRELLGLRRNMVTDTSVVDLPRFGAPDRIAFRNVDRVRRDLLTGGIVLIGKEHKVRIPPELMDDARKAIASQTRHTIKAGPDQPDDPHAWLP